MNRCIFCYEEMDNGQHHRCTPGVKDNVVTNEADGGSSRAPRSGAALPNAGQRLTPQSPEAIQRMEESFDAFIKRRDAGIEKSLDRGDYDLYDENDESY